MEQEPTPEEIEQVILNFFVRCRSAENAGGITLRDAVNGTEIPEDWKLDPDTNFYIPQNVLLYP